MVMALRFPLGLLQLPRCACIEAIATTVATLTLAANATHAPTAVAIIAATTRATATTRNRVQPPALLLQNYCIYGRGAGYRNDTFRTLDATPSAILMHFHSTCRTHREHVGSTRSTHAWPSVCVCVLLGTCITHREPLEKVHMQKRQPCKHNWVPALGVAPHADTRKCMQQGGCTIPLSTCGSRCATQRVQRSCRLYQQHARQSAISEKTRIAAGNGGLRGGCLVVGLTVNNREGKATVHNTQRCLPQSSVMFNCSGCYPSCGLQICGVAPETFSLSMRSCPSSSQLIVSTNLSHVSSGNHCRSDPVQVQSTSRIVGTAGTTADKTNINVVLPIGPLLGTTWAHACCRLLWVLAPYVGISAGGVWRLWAWVTSVIIRNLRVGCRRCASKRASCSYRP